MKIRIAIVDDEIGKREFIQDILQRSGFKEVRSADCFSPQKFNINDKFDIVILDYDMSPSGPEVAEQIRAKNPGTVLVGCGSWTEEATKKYLNYCANPMCIRDTIDEALLVLKENKRKK